MDDQVLKTKLRFDEKGRFIHSSSKAEKAERRFDKARKKAHYRTVFKQEKTVTLGGNEVKLSEEGFKQSAFRSKLQQGRMIQRGYSAAVRETLKSPENDDNSAIEAACLANDVMDTGIASRQIHERNIEKRLKRAERKLDRANIRDVSRHGRNTISNEQAAVNYGERERPKSSSSSFAGENTSLNPSRVSSSSHMYDGKVSDDSFSRKQHQKERIKREYAKEKREGSRGFSSAISSSASTNAAGKKAMAAETGKKVKLYLGLGAAAVGLLIMLPILLSGSVGGGSLAGFASVAGVFPAEDADMLAAEAYYCTKENDLETIIDGYEDASDHDEYIYDLDAIDHDPYVLISMVSAFRQGDVWTFDEVAGVLDDLYARQYLFSSSVSTEKRTRTETVTDPNTGKEVEVVVEYDYSICTLKLDNYNLSHLPIVMMSEEQLSLYALYMSSLGCRDDLFPESKYISLYITNPPPSYNVDPAYLSADPTFANMIAEGKKYLGYPYVWGGYNPDTSFDCSGFVSWVINHSGWDVGRLGAQGLYGYCTPINKASAKPGDLIFFTRTYEASYPVTHVAIYVGHGMMLHAGDPIQYTSFDTPYYNDHYYSMGRLPGQGG